MDFIKQSSKQRRAIGLACTAVCALFACTSALAQASGGYPNKPIKLVVPYPPGGPTDIVARVVAQKLSEQLGQSIIIDNRPGAGANLGAEAVARSPADGYTLMVATTAHAINPALFSKLNYSITKDFAPISQLTAGPLVIVATPNLAANNEKDMIALAKAKNGEINFASSGNGQSTHLSAELFNAMAGTKMNHIPYKGSAPALTDVMSGQADLMFDTMLSAMPFVKGGKLKAIAVTSAQRLASIKDVPTLKEQGINVEIGNWRGVFGGPGITPAQRKTLIDAIVATTQSASWQEALKKNDWTSAVLTGDAFSKFVDDEFASLRAIMAKSGMIAG